MLARLRTDSRGEANDETRPVGGVPSRPVPSDPPKPKLCEECDSEPATLHCVECEQHLCSSCDQQIHNKGARKNHQRTPIPPDESGTAPVQPRGRAETQTTSDSGIKSAGAGRGQISHLSPPSSHGSSTSAEGVSFQLRSIGARLEVPAPFVPRQQSKPGPAQRNSAITLYRIHAFGSASSLPAHRAIRQLQSFHGPILISRTEASL